MAEPAPIHFQVAGSNFESSMQIAQTIQREAQQVTGAADVRIAQRLDYPIIHIEMDKTLAQLQGVSTSDVMQNLVSATNSSINFDPAFWIDPKNGNHYFIAAQYREEDINSLDTLRDVPITGAASVRPALLRNVAEFRRTTGPAVINHHNITRVIDLYANVLPGHDAGSVVRAIERRLEQNAEIKLVADRGPRGGFFKVEGDAYKAKGYTIQMAGEVRSMRESFRILVTVGLIIFSVLVAGCTGPLGSSAEKNVARGDTSARGAPQVATVEVVAKDLAHKIEMPGSVEGYESVDLYAKIGGYLESIAVDIGDDVREGQVLAKLHVPEMLKELEQKGSLIEQAKAKAEQARAAVHQAEADIATSEAARIQTEAVRKEKQAMRDLRKTEFDRWTELLKTSPSIERRKIDEARHQLEAAQAAVESHEAAIRTAAANVTAVRAKFDKARADEKAVAADIAVAQANYEQFSTMLQYAEIKAPFDGVITKRLVDPGSFIQPATNNSAAKPLLAVARIDKVRIWFDIPMAEVRMLDIGDRTVFDRITVLPGERFEGKVARSSRSLDATSRMMRTEIDLENPAGPNGKRRLLPGYFGYVTILLAEYKEAPTIPASALITRGNKAFVYVVKDSRVHPREVASGYQDGTIVGITSGLEPGEIIVASGAGQLREGQEVVARTPPRTTGG